MYNLEKETQRNLSDLSVSVYVDMLSLGIIFHRMGGLCRSITAYSINGRKLQCPLVQCPRPRWTGSCGHCEDGGGGEGYLGRGPFPVTVTTDSLLQM